jgi:ribosome maturation protein SDO1
MSHIENTIIARLERAGETFELLVDPKLGYAYKTGAKKDLDNVLLVEEVFKNANKGERLTSAALKKAFGTEDVRAIADVIFKEGDLQITTDQRRRLLEEKRVRIVALIARSVVDPRTKAPHPPARIEAAMEQARVHIDAFKNAEEQVPKIIEELREIIPVSTASVKVAIKVPANFVHRVYPALKEYGIRKEEYTQDGSLVALIEIPAAIQEEVYDRLNGLTQGAVQTRLVER